ncbi:Peptidase S8/S53 domain containing protein [Fimbriimonadaceae bacterium]
MKRQVATLGMAALLCALSSANQNYILRYTESEPIGTFLARYNLRLRATVPGKPIYSIQDSLNRDPQTLIQQIDGETDGDVTIERDQAIRLPIFSFKRPQTSSLNLLQQALLRATNVNFYGALTPQGAVTQYTVAQARIGSSWTAHSLGNGTVAVIDTGVDATHPFFAGRVLRGYDYITPNGQGSELTGLTSEVLAQVNPTTTPLLRTKLSWLSNGTAPMFPESTINDPAYSAIPKGLGHGTMVAGAIRLVAPNAKILPIRAFSQNGSGRLFDVIRGMHAAQARGAKVINMSLNTYVYSPELARSSDELSDLGVILVASTGNDGRINTLSYPAALPKVTGVASLTPNSTRSLFSNAGTDLTWVAAPGEGLMLPFPGNRWAGGWGTSFSAPLVSGLALKILRYKPTATYSDLQSALSRSQPLSDPNLGQGGLDVYGSLTGL